MGIYYVAFNLFGIPQGRMFSDYSLASLFHAKYILLEIRLLSGRPTWSCQLKTLVEGYKYWDFEE